MNYALTDHEGRFVAGARTRAGAFRTSRSAHHLGTAVNRSNGDDVRPYQIILQQMGGAGRIRAMIGAQLSHGEDGRRLDIQFPNRMRSRANFVQVRYDPGPDTYTMVFWRMDRMGAGKKLKEMDGIYADSLIEIFERETGLYLRL